MTRLAPPRTAQSLIDAAAQRFSAFPNGALDAEILFRGVSGFSRADILTRGDEDVADEIVGRFEASVVRRERHEPVQYILGFAAFWRDEFMVNPSVLIPRPETEILVEAVATRLRDKAAPEILDVGTGSGCIALSLLRELTDASAIALDLSDAALSVARENALRLGLDDRIEFRMSEWLKAMRAGEVFDAIVSNPPYVAPSDEATLPRDVREFEPSLALYANAADDLSSYRAIAEAMVSHLKPNGLVAFEVGMGQAERVAELMRDARFHSIERLNDLAGIQRVVLGRR